MNDAEGFGMPHFFPSHGRMSPIPVLPTITSFSVHGGQNEDYYQLSRGIMRDDDLTGASNRLFHDRICRSFIRSTVSCAV